MKYINSLSLSLIFFLTVFSNMYYLCSLDPSGSMMLLLYLAIIGTYYISLSALKQTISNRAIQIYGMEILLYMVIVLFYFVEIPLVDYNESYLLYMKREIFDLIYGIVLFSIFIFHRVKNSKASNRSEDKYTD